MMPRVEGEGWRQVGSCNSHDSRRELAAVDQASIVELAKQPGQSLASLHSSFD